MSNANIGSMNDKQLRNEVQLLRDELAIMKRKYGDILYNLDTDNFSSRFVKENKNMKTLIEVTAEGIKTKVSQEDLDNSEKEIYSEISQTATNIRLSVNALDGKLSALESDFSVQADGISSMVSKNISAYFESDTRPTKYATDKEKAMLCLYDDIYWYYSDFDEMWKEYPADGLKTMFRQTEDKFELTGNVTIDGSLVTNISTVNDELHLGVSDTAGEKRIIFNNMAKISSYSDGIGSYGALKISAVKLYLDSKLDLSGCTISDWGNNAPVAVFG